MVEKVLQIRSDIAEMFDSLTAMEAKIEEEKRDMSEQEQETYNSTMAKIKTMREKEQRLIELHGLEDELRDLSKPADFTDPNQPKADEAEWRNLGEFLGAVYKAEATGNVDRRLTESRQMGLNEGVPSEGGFLVQTDHSNQLLKRAYETGALASRVNKFSVGANSNGMTINAVDEDSRVAGSRWGGVQAYWLHEGGAKTPSQPSFRQMELKLKKLIGLCYATDELLQDTTALESIIGQAFSEEFAFMLDDAIFQGNGVGQPLGILGHPATVGVAPEAGQVANTVIFENIVNMWSRMWVRSRGNAIWAINQDIEPQLYTMSLAVGTGGVPVYMPAGGASASPYATLMGRPVVPIEQASSLGNIGDISLLDLSQYLLIDKAGMQSASSIHVRFVNDETTFRFVYRVDGQPAWNAALTPANGNNTLSPFVQLNDRL